MFRCLVRTALSVFLAVVLVSPAWAESVVRVAYLGMEIDRPPVLSNLDDWPEDEGLQGARLGMADNAATGKFLKQTFELDEVMLPVGGDVAAAVADLAAKGHQFVIADLQAPALKAALAVPEAADMLFFNAGAPDDDLRGAACRSNLLHTLPSRAMLGDALGQFLVTKRWTKWFLVVGPQPDDALFADAIRRAAKRFGARIVAEKEWTGEFDLRRSAATEVPLFTQGVTYDVLIVADELGDFGEYLPYQTWDPRPVAGTQGLVPTAWHRVVEAFGAAQLQNRFDAQAGRTMTSRDYAAWAAARSVGEAATRTKAGADGDMAAFIRDPAFQLAAFKGRRLSYRPWDGQLRQPIALAAPRNLVTMAPMEGFLHQFNEMDTLGHDRPESACKWENK